MIQSGDKVRIRPKETKDKTHGSFVSHIEAAALYVNTPLDGTTYFEIAPRTPVEVDIEILGYGGGRVEFSSRIVSQQWDKKRLTKIACPRKLSWVQMRRYVRIDVVVDIEFSVVDAKKPSKNVSLGYPRFQGVTKNVSEGGLMLLVAKSSQVDVNQLIDMQVKLDRDDSFKVRGKILRQIGLPVQDKYVLGVQFTHISDADKEKLRRFIFETGKKRNLRTR
ncbi:MAG: PilZ domain-containing protein [Candidatus Omnitrophica bacterium]|nr:PilZ domain-containing protein [Candidatus Omnitrophota bacterium]